MPERPPAEVDERPSILRGGRYRVRGILGTGSQAQTLEADDLQRGGTVAIKRFSVRGARSWKDVELAEREARVLAELRHPSLPVYVEHFEEDGALYLVMEKIEGKTLAELRRDRALDQGQIVRFLREVAATLSYLHGRAPPIIHRDIKPQNVIQRPDGSFALVDFGSVRDQLRPEGGSTVVGTFGYMAPEQFQGRALSVTDVYGVGATAIACLAGQDPETLPHKGLALDVQAALRGRADRNLVELLARLVEPDPDQRPRDLERAVREALQGRAPPRPRRDEGRVDARTDERRLRAELRDARRRRKRERRDRRREQRAFRPHRERGQLARHGPAGKLLLLGVLIALLLARLATFGLFRLALPIVLGLLALVFRGGLARARERSIEIGRNGEQALRRAMARLQALPPEQPPSEAQPRFRVDDAVHAQTEAQTEDEDTEDEHDQSARRITRRHP